MYVDLLSAILAEEDAHPPTDDLLLEYAVECRDRMLLAQLRRSRSAEQNLACEISYDRALVTLCTACGIEVSPGRFAQAAEERARLERALADSGVDITGSGECGASEPCPPGC
jgi:hypothetical protein